MPTRREFLSGLAAPLMPRGESRPNIVVVLMDDLRWDETHATGHAFAITPNIDRLAREGAMFRNAFVTTPLCSPSRACFLTSQYAHSHGVLDNTDRSALSHRLHTFPRQLHESGYETAFVGKWHMGVDDSPRPGFDHWVSFKGQGTYFDPELNVDGRAVQGSGYMTDILTDRAVDFLSRRRAKPACLWVAHKAVHPELTQYADGSISDPTAGKFTPAPRHQRLFANQKVVRRPNAMRPPTGKPALERKIAGVPPLGPATGTDDETIRNRARMVKAVDEGVGRMLEALERTRQLDRTVFVFTSDEGYFHGEHGLSIERRLSYEESIRIPLIVRYSAGIRAGKVLDPMVINLDLAPTLLELAGVTPGPGMHGRSLLPLLRGSVKDWRSSFLIEYFSDKVMPRMSNMGYRAVRTGRWKYIQYTELTGMDELYDLEADPYEMQSLIADPRAHGTLGSLQAELARLART